MAREAFSSLSSTPFAAAAVSRSRACRIFWENVHRSHVGSLAMSMTASPERGHPQPGEQGMSSSVRCWSGIVGLLPGLGERVEAERGGPGQVGAAGVARSTSRQVAIPASGRPPAGSVAGRWSCCARSAVMWLLTAVGDPPVGVGVGELAAGLFQQALPRACRPRMFMQ